MSPPTSSAPVHPLARCLTSRLGLHGCHGRASITGPTSCADARSPAQQPAAHNLNGHASLNSPHPRTVGRERHGDFGGAERKRRAELDQIHVAVRRHRIHRLPGRTRRPRACLARWSRDPPGRQFARLDLTRVIHYLQGALFSFWLHLDNYCRDAVKIDHNHRPRLNKSALSATVVNVGCIPGCWLTCAVRGAYCSSPDACR